MCMSEKHVSQDLGMKNEVVSNKLGLSETMHYEGICHPLFTFSAPDALHTIIQGTYFDGIHYYVAMVCRDADGFETTRITVLNKEGSIVRVSGVLHIDHANNLTYHPKKNVLIASHCQSPDRHFNRYSAIDLDTLTVVETGDKDKPFFSMAYSWERDEYVSGEWGGETIDYWDHNMVLRKSCSVQRPKTLSQGVFADSAYCYFVRSGQHGVGAEIRVYDWEGRLAFLIPLSIEDHIEPESINIVDGTAYILCNTWPKGESAGIAYRMELIKKPKPSTD